MMHLYALRGYQNIELSVISRVTVFFVWFIYRESLKCFLFSILEHFVTRTLLHSNASTLKRSPGTKSVRVTKQMGTSKLREPCRRLLTSEPVLVLQYSWLNHYAQSTLWIPHSAIKLTLEAQTWATPKELTIVGSSNRVSIKSSWYGDEFIRCLPSTGQLQQCASRYDLVYANHSVCDT